MLLVVVASSVVVGSCQRPSQKLTAVEQSWRDSLVSALEAQNDKTWHTLGDERYSCLVWRGDSLLGLARFGTVAAQAEYSVLKRRTTAERRQWDSLMTGDHPRPIEIAPWCARVDSTWYATMAQRARGR